MKKDRLKNLIESILNEGDVISLDRFKSDRETSMMEYYIVSKDGHLVFPSEEFVMVKITTMAQQEAIIDANPEKAQKLGAKFFELEMGEETEVS